VLVLGCDGLWDVVGNADAVAIALRWAWAALPGRLCPLPRCDVKVLIRQPAPTCKLCMRLLACSSPSAEAAANALLHAAQRKWAAAHGGVFADDITVAVAFLPA
jgi:serine/threonine protein phosphatase PrpC